MKPLTVLLLLFTLLSGAIACQPTLSTQENSRENASENAASSEGLPGEGIAVTPVQMNLTAEHFQTAIVSKALERLGYEVEEPHEVTAAISFVALANGDADFTAIHWERLNQDFYEKNGGEEKLTKLGALIEDTVQGYQVDKKTAEEHNITNLEQLKDPEVAKLFDSDGNGKANLAGCPPGWGCELVIEHHLDAYGLRETVEHNQGEYGVLIANTIARYRQGESVLFFTWRPMWVEQVLKTDEDTMWLEVPYTDLPEEQGELLEKDTTYKGKNLGFAIDRVLVTANKEFIDANPAAKKLLSLIEIPIADISAQNQLIEEGEDSTEDILRHADEWIEKNQETFDSWIAESLKVASENQ